MFTLFFFFFFVGPPQYYPFLLFFLLSCSPIFSLFFFFCLVFCVRDARGGVMFIFSWKSDNICSLFARVCFVGCWVIFLWWGFFFKCKKFGEKNLPLALSQKCPPPPPRGKFQHNISMLVHSSDHNGVIRTFQSANHVTQAIIPLPGV